ncbi:hypothetical protein ACOSP7_002365 [Xanthoceras sorbifolium]
MDFERNQKLILPLKFIALDQLKHKVQTTEAPNEIGYKDSPAAETNPLGSLHILDCGAV